jgi:lysophospholipase L1-like esterase
MVLNKKRSLIMVKYLSNLLFIIFAIVLVSGCKDRSDITSPPSKSGSADFTRYVAIGNSITAGYQSSALYQDAQQYAYGNLIAQQVNTSFAMPLVSQPGLGGQLYVHSFSTTSADIRQLPSTGSPLNVNYPAPYNNLGIPGALLWDVLNAKSSTTCASYLLSAIPTPNPFFDLVLRPTAGLGTQFQQARLLHPTFVTLWIGNNDVLGFAASGGFAPSSTTDATTFQTLYEQLSDSISKLGAKVVVANIPDVTNIPFFTTVGPLMAMEIPWSHVKLAGSPGIFYQKHGVTLPDQTTFTDSLHLATLQVLITLTGQSYASLIGTKTGKWYKDNHYPQLPPGIDTNQYFGLHPQNPWPDALILDPSEIQTAEIATNAFNHTISTIASTKGFGLVDINSIFKSIFVASITSGGGMYYGVKLSTMFVSGGLFSLDGVHPTSRGQGLIANEFLKVINNKFGSNFPLLNLAIMPGSIQLGKKNFSGNFQFDVNDWRNFSL